jgi:uncharacterized protein with FMN-binding domain
VGDKKVANGMVAIGSVAVMAVYGAGYAKTRAAADRFAQQAAERRPHVPSRSDREATALDVDAPPPVAPVPAPAEPSLADRAKPPEASEAKPNAITTRVEDKPTVTAPAVTKSAAPAEPAAPSPTVAPAAIDDEEPAALAQASAVQPAAAPPIAPQVPAAQPAAPQAQAPVPAPAPPAVAPQAPAKPGYKDGTFYGWGTSRHGDIQAAVVIENGRITVARVERCLTRYSCSWITPLPPRVLLKQGNTYDYVSGATESSDAFQDAVAEALSTAK